MPTPIVTKITRGFYRVEKVQCIKDINGNDVHVPRGVMASTTIEIQQKAVAKAEEALAYEQNVLAQMQAIEAEDDNE